MSHKHTSMEAPLRSLLLQGTQTQGSWWPSITPPTMAPLLNVDHRACARSSLPWLAQFYPNN